MIYCIWSILFSILPEYWELTWPIVGCRLMAAMVWGTGTLFFWTKSYGGTPDANEAGFRLMAVVKEGKYTVFIGTLYSSAAVGVDAVIPAPFVFFFAITCDAPPLFFLFLGLPTFPALSLASSLYCCSSFNC
jgi:hypothetical protein